MDAIDVEGAVTAGLVVGAIGFVGGVAVGVVGGVVLVGPTVGPPLVPLSFFLRRFRKKNIPRPSRISINITINVISNVLEE
jgi:hypothetical protein